MLSSPVDINNCFAKHWSILSEDSNFSPNFRKQKSDVYSLTYNPKPNTNEDALRLAKSKTPGDDRMLKRPASLYLQQHLFLQRFSPSLKNSNCCSHS